MVVSTSASYDELYPVANTVYGDRWGFAQLAATGTSVTITYDLGTGFSRTVDHLILGGAQVLRANGVTQVTLQGSSNGSVWVDQLGTAAGFQTRTMMGPDGDDVIFTAAVNDQYAAALAAYRYWRVTLAGGAAHKFPVSKIYFGAAFDAVSEPDMYDLAVQGERDADTWRFPRGHVTMSKAFYPKHRFRVEWDGLSDALARSLMTTLLANPFKNHVFLYTGTWLDPLYDNRLVHARVVDEACSVTRRKGSGNWNDCVMVFEEL
jgi:hypothetical protein